MVDHFPNRTRRPLPPHQYFAVEAEEMLRTGDAAGAAELCKRGLVFYPEYISGYAVLARSFLALGRTDRALNTLEAGWRRTGAEGLLRMQRILSGAEPFVEEIETGRAGSFHSDTNEVPANGAGTNGDEANRDAATGIPVSEKTTPREEPPSPAQNFEIDAEDVAPSAIAGTELAEPDAADTLVAEPSAETFEIEPPIPAGMESGAVIEEQPNVPLILSDTIAPSETTVSEAAETELAADVEDSSESLGSVDRTIPGLQGVGPKLSEGVEPEIESAGQRSHEPESLERSLEPRSHQAESRPTGSSEAQTHRTEEKAQERRPKKGPGGGSLSLHTGTKRSRLRSSNLRLIPGLEFAPLRRGDEPSSPSVAPLIEDSLPAHFRSERTDDAGMTAMTGPTTQASETVRPEDLLPPLPVASTVQPETPAKPETTSPDEAATVEAISTEFTPAEPAATAGTARQAIAASATDEGVPATDETIGPGADAEAPTEESTPDVPGSRTPRAARTLITLPPKGAHRDTEAQSDRPGSLTPLEELARRLENARIPIVEEEEEPSRPTFRPSIVSDTYAAILERQGAWSAAIKAYRELARLKPERRAEYEAKIEEIEAKEESEE